MTQTTIGDLLRRHRLEPTFIEKDALTQKELADMIGCHNSVVSRVERGDQWPTPEYLKRFITVLNLPAEETHKIWAAYRPDAPSRPTSSELFLREDWDEALDVVFYGRQAELAQLQQWIMTDRCRLVAVLGLGGIGKTALATTLARQVTLERPTNLDDDIYTAALQLFEKHWPPGKRVRLIGVGVSGLETAAYQLGLWTNPEQEQSRRLQPVLDELRERFGRQVIRRGSQLLKDGSEEA